MHWKAWNDSKHYFGNNCILSKTYIKSFKFYYSDIENTEKEYHSIKYPRINLNEMMHKQGHDKSIFYFQILELQDKHEAVFR